MNLKIHIAQTANDLAVIADMARELSLFHDEDIRPDPIKLAADKDWFTALIAIVDGREVGFVSCFKGYETHYARRFIEIQNLFVHADYRGKKIGLALMREAFALGNAWDVDVYKIGVRKTNQSAMQFYRQLGFTFTEEALNFRGKKIR